MALTSFTGASSTSRLTIVDLPEPLGPDKTTIRCGFFPGLSRLDHAATPAV